MKFRLAHRLCAEFLGTAFLLTAVVGSGIMGERLSGGNVAIALLANSIATGAALVTLIFTFGGISGAHFNPVVTLADSLLGGLARSDILPYLLCAASGRYRGNYQFTLDVRPAGDYTLASRAKRPRTILRGDYRYIWTTGRNFGVFKASASRNSVDRRSVHRRRLLVYFVDFFCEPCGHGGAMYHGHVCGNPAAGCSRICAGPISWQHCSISSFSMDGSFADQCRKWRMPVKTMAMPRRSAARITSLSRTEPPG